MPEVMLDLETWGTAPGCAIRSIGAIAFHLDERGPSVNCYYSNIDDISCSEFNLIKEKTTVQWWERADLAASAAFSDPAPVHIAIALARFRQWWCIEGNTTIWAHGAVFDIPIIEHAMRKLGMSPPWHYRNIRDTRTLYAIAGFNPEEIKFDGTPHHALDDARHQVKCVQEAMKRVTVNTL